MANRKEYLEFVTEWLAPLGQISTRSMFGGHTVYCDGTVFALVADNVLYLKADPASRPRFQERGLKPFQPFPDRPEVMQYYPPPPEFFEDPDVMKQWARAAVNAGNRSKKVRRTRG